MSLQLPEDTNAERMLLSTICAPGAERMASDCLPSLSKRDFVSPIHQAIFEALKVVLDRGDQIEIPLIADTMRISGTYDRCGGFSGLIEVLGADVVRRPMVLVEILNRNRMLRDLVIAGSRMSRAAQDHSADPRAICGEVCGILSGMMQAKGRGGIKHISDMSDDALAEILDEFNGVRAKNTTYLKGWSRFNGMTRGLKGGQLIILAARPGIGKTALALNWMLAATDYERNAAGMFSLEMSGRELWKRLVSAQAGVDIRSMVDSRDHDAFNRVGYAKEELDQRGIWIEDKACITPQEIMAETDHLITKNPNIRLLIVDYLGLVSSNEGSSAKTEVHRIAEITRGLKMLAKDRNIPILLLCQMNREAEKRSGGKPQLSDLRDSGAIEQDADMVLFIHRNMRDKGAELIIAKQRNGPIGSIPLIFRPELTRYEEQQRETDARLVPYQEPIAQEPYFEEAV